MANKSKRPLPPPVNVKKVERRSEFRYANKNTAGGHPAYIYAKVGGKFRYLGITHSDTVSGHKTKKLRRNPNPNSSKDSYIILRVEQASESSFGSRRSSWSFDPQDKKEVHEFISKKAQKKKNRRRTNR